MSKKPAKVPARTPGAATTQKPTLQRVMVLVNGRRRTWAWRDMP
jgi:hypothetical protein